MFFSNVPYPPFFSLAHKILLDLYSQASWDIGTKKLDSDNLIAVEIDSTVATKYDVLESFKKCGIYYW